LLGMREGFHKKSPESTVSMVFKSGFFAFILTGEG